ncbi:MAG: hypothetical protein MR274_09895 [Clostridium sp.]|nr:hypothetical protein [Clostridium sp.]MDY3827589.1 hypothetical protein [Clostridium sp.]
MNNSVKYNSIRSEFFRNIEEQDVFERFFPKTIKTRMNSFVRKTLSITGMYSVVRKYAKKILRK